MGKKRRERDRPKAGPASVYNPNKRVLLSYASDEEVEGDVDQSNGTGHPEAIDASTSDYQIAPYPEDEHGNTDETKAVVAEAPLEDRIVVDTANAAPANQAAQYSRPTSKNPITGQWPALGSVRYQHDDNDDGQTEYESEEEEAMAYLRAVRNERLALPEVAHAPYDDEKEQLYGSGVGDARGYVEDGAYIGRPEIGPVMPPSAKTQITAREAYTSALKRRFLEQREQMHQPPGAAALASLDENHPTVFVASSNKSYAQWTRLLTSTAPLPAQIRALDSEAAKELLQLLQRLYMKRGEHLHERLGVWIWSLLARLDDVGTMDNDEVYTVRDFGKRAVLVQLSFSDPTAALHLESMDGTDAAADAKESGAVQSDADAGASKEGEPRISLDITSPAALNTLVTLDAVITIVGEVFGQRDLLEFRRDWGVETPA
ncbi:hypothetical protein LTR62_006925 [Meristemomyces frigidus]|uniref:Uncharacterized protein n=1 Tax=Meristemomyces frigidus TaxID=1508187 RepID=A0AAN7YMN3_9PEZI|nr:hypothetical protein LTR62_006925 [Meristemomyces frigidus]